MSLPKSGRNRTRPSRSTVDIDLKSLCSVDHLCNGCISRTACCCSTYEVCITATEMRRIIRIMPEVVKLCPKLLTDDGYDNVFEYVGAGLYAIDTNEDGLCLFAYTAERKIQCALHTVGVIHGIPLAQVKPKACLLWPMIFSEGEEALSLTDDALLFQCTTLKRKGPGPISSSFTKAIDIVYGEGCGKLVEQAAAKGVGRLKLEKGKKPRARKDR